MAPKNRPTPLADASLSGPSQTLTSNLTVKNTFIDMPSTAMLSPENRRLTQGVITAPPCFDSNFVTNKMKQMMSRPLASPLPTGSTIPTFMPTNTSGSSNVTSLSFTPLQTPSPSGFRPGNWLQIKFPAVQENMFLPNDMQQNIFENNWGPEEDDDDDEYEYYIDQSQANLPLPSKGSVGHFQGTCKRCCFFPRGRCMNGENCEFCHFDHDKRKRKNKKKKTYRWGMDRFRMFQQWPPCPAPPPAPAPYGTWTQSYNGYSYPAYRPPANFAPAVSHLNIESSNLPPPPASPNKSLLGSKSGGMSIRNELSQSGMTIRSQMQ